VKDDRVFVEVHRDDSEDYNYVVEATRLLIKKGLLSRVNSNKLLDAMKRNRAFQSIYLNRYGTARS